MSLKINRMILEGDNAIQNTSPIILEKVFYNENVCKMFVLLILY